MSRVGLVEEIFWPNPPWWTKKKIQPNPTQPNPSHKSNPTHMGRVEPMGWTTFFITIIIKLSRKKYIKPAT